MAATQFEYDASSGRVAAIERGPTRSDGRCRSAATSAEILKRVFDVIFAALGLVVLSPLFLAIALAIKLTDPGPVFYRHRRLGLVGKPTFIHKFRTMKAEYSTGEQFGGRTDADVLALLGSPDQHAEFERVQKLFNDPRISRVGRFLRQTSLDELPQLWNILRGELSAVGPRPIVVAELDKYGSGQEALLSLRPGLTGLWQVSGRNDLDYSERVQLDLYYAENWSLLLDLKIVLRTVPAVLQRRGAY
jgi:lipopolysaccharide/colanic/teichoic acid biosynthesis glycosyltransferase